MWVAIAGRTLNLEKAAWLATFSGRYPGASRSAVAVTAVRDRYGAIRPVLYGIGPDECRVPGRSADSRAIGRIHPNPAFRVEIPGENAISNALLRS